jgi:hypothetical protein
MGELMEITGLAISVLTRLVPPAIKWMKGGPLDQSVQITADQFPELGNLKASLVRWCEDSRVAGEFQRAREGQTRDVNLDLLTDVLLDHDFAGTVDPPAEARKVVEVFFSVLESKLLENPTQSGRFIYGTLQEQDARAEQRDARIFDMLHYCPANCLDRVDN